MNVSCTLQQDWADRQKLLYERAIGVQKEDFLCQSRVHKSAFPEEFTLQLQLVYKFTWSLQHPSSTLTVRGLAMMPTLCLLPLLPRGLRCRHCRLVA